MDGALMAGTPRNHGGSGDNRGLSPVLAVFVALVVAVLCLPSAALADPVAPDCASVTVGACYQAALAAGFTSFDAISVTTASCTSDPVCVAAGYSTAYGNVLTGAGGANQYPTAGSGGTGGLFEFAYFAPDADVNGCNGGVVASPGQCLYTGSAGGFAPGSEPAGFLSDAATYGGYGGGAGPSGATYPIDPVVSGATADLVSYIPVVLLVVGAVIALCVGLRLIRKWART